MFDDQILLKIQSSYADQNSLNLNFYFRT